MPGDVGPVISMLYRRDALFSLATLLSENKSFKIVFGVVWIICGLLLLFFGLDSFRWLSSFRSKGSSIPSTKQPRRILGAGVGGILIGFLAGSTLSILLITSFATRQSSTLTPGGLLVAWLIPGLIVAPLAGHFSFLSRVLTGLLGSMNLVLLLTALGGVHTLATRAALLVVAAPVLTVPLLIPPKSRWGQVKWWLLNINTSFVGAMIFLDGIALFASPQDTSHAWLDLWTLLFAPDLGASESTIVQQWGTTAFKGYVAGAIILVLAGIAFEWYFDHCADEDVGEEWSDYLGVSTEQAEKDTEGRPDAAYMPEMGGSRAYGEVRAGILDVPQSLWARIKSHGRYRRGAPAAYGGYSEGRSTPLAEQPSYTERVASIRSFRRSGRRPARYVPHEDEEAIDGDFDVEFEGVYAYADQQKDGLHLAIPQYTSPGMPRIPSYSSEPHQSQSSSLISGSTAVEKTGEEISQKDLDNVSPPATAFSGDLASQESPGQVTATPSLLNAVERIQRAQQETRMDAESQSVCYASAI
ncbi:hypothetical protein BCV69DRAFT_300001 [Microstroma glucosiphilum]|uniref:TM7S3/TM198-like domain-containing protein n=1 Tax=Pseudomicrostroma glucosiphilum TaxID=1684307 RepID=A0A316U5G2_9BASI|nr:hypothetical protein BCV69DRAFT_300001 [Pseudomicrostroma glucosiphilum]PWN19691.1 hypothetical protein BCV69DRAFT_300001 [Pseudomicrostroma glucosiphilum]